MSAPTPSEPCLMSDLVCPSSIASCTWASFCTPGFDQLHRLLHHTNTFSSILRLLYLQLHHRLQCRHGNLLSILGNLYVLQLPRLLYQHYPAPGNTLLRQRRNPCSWPLTCSPTFASPTPPGPWRGVCQTPALLHSISSGIGVDGMLRHEDAASEPRVVSVENVAHTVLLA